MHVINNEQDLNFNWKIGDITLEKTTENKYLELNKSEKGFSKFSYDKLFLSYAVIWYLISCIKLRANKYEIVGGLRCCRLPSTDLAASIWKMAAQVGDGPEREDQRMVERAESLMPGKVVP